MTKKPPETISAQVVLRPATDHVSDEQRVITAATIGKYLPSQEDAGVARSAFIKAGFEVGELVGNSFSIAGTRTLFEKTLRIRVRGKAKDGPLKAVRPDGSASFELPTDALWKEARRVIETITFTPPPDFGPTSF